MKERDKYDFFVLSDILKSLSVSNYEDYTSYIYKNNDFNHFHDMCKNSVNKCEYQFGGGKQIITYEGIEFEFSKYRDEEYTMFGLFTKNDSVKCLLIRINKKLKSAEILGIGYYPFCFSNKQIKHFKGKTSGSLLLKLALKLIDEIKEYYDLKKVTLQDNSYKKCYDFNLDLSKMYTLMYGEIWYGNYGFIPYNTANDTIDNFNLKKYKKNKEIMNDIKVKDVSQLKKYLIESYNNIIKDNKGTDVNELLLKRDEITKMYNEYKNENKLLKDFIKKFLIKYDKTCLLFYSFYELLYEDLNLNDLHGKSYVKYL